MLTLYASPQGESSVYFARSVLCMQRNNRMGLQQRGPSWKSCQKVGLPGMKHLNHNTHLIVPIPSFVYPRWPVGVLPLDCLYRAYQLPLPALGDRTRFRCFSSPLDLEIMEPPTISGFWNGSMWPFQKSPAGLILFSIPYVPKMSEVAWFSPFLSRDCSTKSLSS